GAQDYVTVPDAELSDTDFYRVVSCAAPPGAPCQKQSVRWPDQKSRDLTARIVSVAPQYDTALRAQIDSALDHAIDEINAAGTIVQMRRAGDTEKPLIELHLVALSEGDTLTPAPDPELDGITLPAAYVHIWWGSDAQLQHTIIVFSDSITRGEVRSITLEEMLQATGLITDIDSPYYSERSIFAENGPNAIATLEGQDLRAFQSHYPAR
ncbi:MAG: hypothetical protein V2I76_08835, partial [Roseobacter sp.]|nr:hypothetical protein [Roseobacter sp.]